MSNGRRAECLKTILTLLLGAASNSKPLKKHNFSLLKPLKPLNPLSGCTHLRPDSIQVQCHSRDSFRSLVLSVLEMKPMYPRCMTSMTPYKLCRAVESGPVSGKSLCRFMPAFGGWLSVTPPGFQRGRKDTRQLLTIPPELPRPALLPMSPWSMKPWLDEKDGLLDTCWHGAKTGHSNSVWPVCSFWPMRWRWIVS